MEMHIPTPHSHAVRVLGWGVGFSHRHWGPEIALEFHYLRAVAAEAESRGEKNQFSPRAPLSASTSLCPNAGAIPLFLFLPSVLPNKAHSPPQHTQDTNTLPPLNLLLVQCSCQFQVLVVLKSDYAEGTIPHLCVSRGPPNIHTCNHPPSLPPKDRFRNHMVSLASCAAMQFSFICSNSQWEFVLSITTFCLL